MTNKNLVPIIIPSYDSDEKLITLLEELDSLSLGPVILVNDGSSQKCEPLLSRAEEIIKKSNGHYISYPTNQGKGYALKTAFKFVLENYPEAIGVVTADSDGQHSPKNISAISDELRKKQNTLILGVREFNTDDVPWKSRFGNSLTIKIFKLVSGVYVSDTQTGLRGIPKKLMEECLNIKGNRFEFEMEMLLQCAEKCYDISETTIATIYDSKENHQTHFNPIKDSIKIYKLFGTRILKFLFSSFSAFAIDLLLFTIFCASFKAKSFPFYILLATALARVISATYNYIVNYKVVFKSQEKYTTSAIKYIALGLALICLSSLFTTIGSKIFTSLPETIIKVVVDSTLFLLSYKIQRKYVF